MKTRFFLVAMMVAVVGFGACGGGKAKSDKCELLEISISNVKLTQQSGNVFTHLFEKTDENKWTGWAGGNPKAIGATSYEISPKATITPDPKVAQDYETGVTFTVTAEDGVTKKTFTAKITMDVLR